MAKHIDVIYTNGVFRPAERLELELEEGIKKPRSWSKGMFGSGCGRWTPYSLPWR
jgi:hypothetical protein